MLAIAALLMLVAFVKGNLLVMTTPVTLWVFVGGTCFLRHSKRTGKKLAVGAGNVKNAKVFILATIAILLLFVCCAMWKLRSLRSNESKYRPEIFPNALIAPPNGENVLYDSSELSKKLPKGCYSLSYSVKERYPGTATRDFFGKTLEANGWRKLEGSLLLPKSTRAIDWTLKITEDGVN